VSARAPRLGAAAMNHDSTSGYYAALAEVFCILMALGLVLFVLVMLSQSRSARRYDKLQAFQRHNAATRQALKENR
jgi:hypothetical protein